MKALINISEKDFEKVKLAYTGIFGDVYSLIRNAITEGVELPEGAEILTKEAYSDLCMRASSAEREEVYERGLNDAWECAKKIATSDGLQPDELETIFDHRGIDPIFECFSASEAIAKVKEYEDRQKKTNDEIHVGDEFFCLGSKYKYVVLGFLGSKIFAFSNKGLTGVFDFNQVYKTGRKYPITEILEGLND